MFELTFFAVVSLGFLATFFLLGAKGRSACAPNVPAVDVPAINGAGRMIRLKGLSFGNSARMLDDSDYRILAANPRLRGIADQFRSERKKLILQWISALLCDLQSLWRFRRVLVRHGAPVRVGEELKILRTFVVCLMLLFGLRFLVRVTGPFVVGHLVSQAVGFVGKMSDVTAGTLARVPSSVWPEIERSWAAQAA